MGSFSLWHWLVVLLIIVLVFGTKKLRNIGSDLGGAVRDFKQGMRDEKEGSTPSQAQLAENAQNGQTLQGEIRNKSQS